MSLRVIGAGWPRTGTTSLKVALEKLLSERCYHMYDLFADTGQIEIWEQALAATCPACTRLLVRVRRGSRLAGVVLLA